MAMLLYALLLVPAAAGALALAWRRPGAARVLLPAGAAAHAMLTATAWLVRPGSAHPNWLALDDTGLLFLSIASALFLAAAIYAPGYLRGRDRDARTMSEPLFAGCALLFLASMTLVTLSRHFGLLWVAVEATTLASAPLIYYHRDARSLEATWKYLILCSVGIALALLGTFSLSVAGEGAGLANLSVDELVRRAAGLNPTWLQAAALLLLVGYGTKMGLAPMHTWLPDAHSEAPSMVSALLSGALLNCAFLGLLRVRQVVVAAGLQAFDAGAFLVLGVLSVALAWVFIARQADFKRLLAYSSVEHMGLLAIGIGLGGGGPYASLFHALNHSLVKAALFLLAGNLLTAYGSKAVEEVRGALRVAPRTARLWLLGLFAITGFPPFGVFVGKFQLLRAAAQAGRIGLAVLLAVLLAMIFIAMSSRMLPMVFGPAPGGRSPVRERWGAVLPSLVLLLASLALGLWLPAPLAEVLARAARTLGGAP